MNYVQFVLWAGKQGFKYGQRYLNKAWQEATKGGKQILESQFPKLLNKARDYYGGFKRAGLKSVPKVIKPIVPKTKITPKVVAPKFKKPGFHPSVIKGGKKADGGRIDKVPPTRSRDI